VSPRFISTLLTHLCLGLPSGKILLAFLPIVYMNFSSFTASYSYIMLMSKYWIE
jgi:hypothetical protein